MGAGKPKDKDYPLMTRGDVEAMIAEGRKILVMDQHILKVDAWLMYHPGGDKAILHMVGKDATDEITAYVMSMATPTGHQLSRTFDLTMQPDCTPGKL